jgi:hypothetical protein
MLSKKHEEMGLAEEKEAKIWFLENLAKTKLFGNGSHSLHGFPNFFSPEV